MPEESRKYTPVQQWIYDSNKSLDMHFPKPVIEFNLFVGRHMEKRGMLPAFAKAALDAHRDVYELRFKDKSH